MELIPVIDIAGGVVVRAVRGDRANYKPIVSRLCPGHDPATVAAALVDWCAARTLYVADLDAIRGGALQQNVLANLAAAIAPCTLWVDGGFQRMRDAQALATIGRGTVAVFGSESLADVHELERLRGRDDVLLSLDQRGGQPMDPAGCWQRDDCWPGRVIVMTLDRVGAGSGPDLATLEQVRARANGRALIGAGGVRNAADLRAAAAAGAAAWLVASALHDGGIGRVERGRS